MISMFSALVTDRKSTGFTVFYINFARMSHTGFFCWCVVQFFMVRHDIMVYCFEIVYMIFLTLGTQITWTRYTIILCVPLTLRAKMYSISDACCFHNVECLVLKIKHPVQWKTNSFKIKKNVSTNP